MPHPLIVRVLGETSQFEKSLARSVRSAFGFERTLKKVSVTAQESANAQISAAVRKDARLRDEITTYRAVAAAAEKGSREQVAAANLAARSERTLARSLATTSAEARTLSASSGRFERDIGKATRGALAGSGIFRSLGRSLAFASGGFLAFAGPVAFLRKSIDAARDAQVVERQLAQQFKNNRRDLAPYRHEIDRTSNAISALSGFTNDELKAALTTILRTQPNVTKAIRDEATAADLARAKRIGLAQSAIILAKVEGGNTTLLRRQGIQVAKNATAEQALAVLRQKVAGQARAGATEQERFGAILHNTEEIIGTGVLPTLNRYLESGGRYLQQLNESGDLERKVAAGAKEFKEAIHDAGVVIHDVDSLTGSFKNTLELLLALKVAGWAAGIVGGVGGAVGGLTRARFGAKALGGELAVGNASLAAQAGIASFALTTLGLHATGLDKDLRVGGAAVERFAEKIGKIPGFDKIPGIPKAPTPLPRGDKAGQLGGVDVAKVIALARQVDERTGDTLAEISAVEKKFTTVSHDDLRALVRIADTMILKFRAAGGAAEEAGVKAAHGLALAQQAADAAAAATTGAAGATTARRGINITIDQRNRFFDTKTSRALNRIADQGLADQFAGLNKIEARLKDRLKVTKDITRQQNLEDQILEIERQKTGVRGQLRQGFLDSLSGATGQAEFRVQVAAQTKGFGDDIKALEQLQRAIKAQIAAEGKTADLEAQLFQNQQNLAAARASQISGRQFAALGLTETGEKRTPGVRALRRALGNVEDEVSGTFLDTKKTRSLLSAIRRILSGGLGSVGEEVRAKIQSILGDLNRQLDNSTQKNLTKWKHLSAQAFLAGVPDLTPAQRRLFEKKFSTLGPGGTVPPRQTAAFALAGPRSDASGRGGGDVFLDGEKVGRITKNHQIRRGKKRTVPRAG